MFIIFDKQTKCEIRMKNGNLVKTIDLAESAKSLGITINSLYFIKVPRLEWSDRILDIIYQSNRALVSKLIFAGTCLKKNEDVKQYLLLYSTKDNKITNIKMLKTGSPKITCLEYGPYDNGHILVGLSNGTIIVYNSFDLSRMHQFSLFDSPIKLITLDPTNLVFISAGDEG